MYADRYHSSRTSRPVSAGAALLLNGALIAGLIFAAPDIVRVQRDSILETRNVPIPAPPPPEPQPRPPEPATRTVTTTLPHQPPPLIPTPPSGPAIESSRDPGPVTLDPPAPPGPPTPPVAIDPPRAPVMVDAMPDPRYARDFQPDYPASELRAEREGLVRVRIRIGADGRVKSVEQLASPSAALFDATRRHALSAWRFKPATRDGVPVESMKVMTVRFQITG
ncbi:energy transducer TonB [Sphingomonas sp.]|uniref:energy transducer TonB n=1 Tax=Sphingomonas sp. TaxID=28214 RepID=UPI001EB63858|nr:energy transducer TonB [Sphingomonas sp.]MBX3593701.1 energy transducer TonB [Sphingomonas sp.]